MLSQLSYAPPHITNAKISIAEKGCPVNGKLTHSFEKNQEKLTIGIPSRKLLLSFGKAEFFNN